ncbi:MAG: AsmA-like C-terminal domain-containing protein [Alphaproteobacteria bacterium]|nr:AsmA-like C-terminal domain-containing protein [Alphaproteobacteria bacterium]
MVKQFWRFSKKITSFCWKMVEIFLTLIFVLGGLLLYYLHKEPIDAMEYIPEIERTLLPTSNGYHMQAKSVILTSDWARDGLIQIDIEDLQVLRGDQTILFSAPSAHFSYDLWHILTLNYMPSTIIVERPFLEMVIDEKGTVIVKSQGASPHNFDVSLFKKMLERVLAIRELNITDAHFRLKDDRFKQQWDIQDANLELGRRFRFTNRARLNATLLGEGVNSRFLATATLNRFTRLLSLETGLDKINLKKLSPFIPVLQEADLDTQLSVKGQFDMAKSHKKMTDYISKVQFNAKTLKSGTLNLMDDLDNLYYVQSADINGTLGQGAKRLKIASSKVQLKDEKPVDFYLDVTGIDTFLNSRDITQLKTTLKATLYDVPTSHVSSLWPSKQGPDAHAWVRRNLSEGKLTQADFTLYFNGDELVDLFGDIHATGVRVDYLNPMKPVNDVSAEVLLYPDKVHILLEKGFIGDLALEKGELLFTDIDKDQSWLKIDLDVSGPVKQALELISSKPLEFPQMFNLKPSMISGQSRTSVQLYFPLDENLTTQQVKAKVHSDVVDVKVNAPLEQFGLKNGTLKLDVTNEGLKIKGDIFMKNSPLKFEWHEYFTPDKISSEYNVSGNLKSMDIGGFSPVLAPLFDGQVDADFQAVKTTDGLYSGTLVLNAEKAWIDLAPLAVQKKKGNPMTLLFSFDSVNDKKGKLEWDIFGNLLENQDDLKITGQADWSSKQVHVLLTHVLAGANLFSGELKTTKDDFSLMLNGKNWQAYDLGKVLSSSNEQSDSAGNSKNITLDIVLDKFSLKQGKPFKKVSVTGKRQGALWQSFHAQAEASEPFVIVYNPHKSQFHGSFSDVGDLLERLNLSERFTGGQLSLSADQDKKGFIEGKIRVDRTELKETGFLMQALTILGIVDAFRGKDMEFDEIEIPFVLTPDFQLNFEDAHAVGTNLGITFRGKITAASIDLSGSVVPAYAVNSLPGKIPVVGWLFRDSEGGGLINVPFTVVGPLSNPEIEWNALGTVAPGALGRLF